MFSRTWKEHLQRLEAVFRRLLEAGLTLGASKCKLALKEVEFLGHVVSEEGLRPNPRLLDSIRQIAVPTTVTEVRSFLGLVGYYRRFIKGFSEIATPLNRLLEKGKEIQWTAECQQAFEILKGLSTTGKCLLYLNFLVPQNIAGENF